MQSPTDDLIQRLWNERDETGAPDPPSFGNPKRFLAGCIVVDEVHASDAYMARILEDVLARHWMAGGHAILLSATLGSEARMRLLAPGKRLKPPSVEAAEAAPYPLITHRGEIQRTVSVVSDVITRVIQIESRPLLENAEGVASEVFAAGIAGAKFS